MTKDNDIKMIRVTKCTHELLQGICKKGETYNELILKLIKLYRESIKNV